MINGVGPLEIFEATVGLSVIANSSFVRENEIRLTTVTVIHFFRLNAASRAIKINVFIRY